MDVTMIDPDQVDHEIDSHGYVVIKEPGVEQACFAARREYESCLQAAMLHPPRQRFDYKSLAQGPWRKLAIGSSNGAGDAFAQLLQSTYFAIDDNNYPQLNALFRLITAIRNRLMRVDQSFGDVPERDGFWNACRVHHYPRGGGFMTKHKDASFSQLLGARLGKPYYQVGVLLSRKNIDFFDGGGFVITNRNEKIDLEIQGGFGSIVIFDGRVDHGVDDVDLDQVLDFSKSDGRLAAFANLYRVM
jgi:hypothetical protein